MLKEAYEFPLLPLGLETWITADLHNDQTEKMQVLITIMFIRDRRGRFCTFIPDIISESFLFDKIANSVVICYHRFSTVGEFTIELKIHET